MLSIKEAIVVEGKYDKIKVERIFDTVIIETSGFAVFNNSQLRNYICQAAEKRGLIILTDPDSAGQMIRNCIKSAVDNSMIKIAYVPDRFGKEKRKNKPSAEGKLGVEGLPDEIIKDSVLKAGATVLGSTTVKVQEITKTDFYILGLSGCSNSSLKRNDLKQHLDLPSAMSSNELLTAVNTLFTRNEFIEYYLRLCNN